jgi:Concanavalin A-like lectin/glucanases superfamily/MBG domain (YGX type)/Bacterial Ig-like domain (group 3)/IPT/TIG domain/MBG domain
MRMRLAARAAFSGALAAITIAGLVLQSGDSIRAQAALMRWDGLLEGISVTSSYYFGINPEAANGPNRMSRHAISADGRYVLFESMAQNIGAYYDWWLFLRDRATGETRTITAGATHDPVLSADGNHVAFSACESYWRPDGLPICDIFGVDPHISTFRRLTELPDGTPGDGDSAEPVLSSTGRFVVFRTSATNLFPIGAGQDQIALLDRDADGNGFFDEPGTAHFEAISVTTAGFAGNGPSSSAEVSEDGRFVAFRSGASDLVAGDTNGVWDVFLRDRQSGITRRINVRPQGQESFFPVNAPAISMTPDGRFVAYSSADGMLAAGYPDDMNNMEDVFVYDALTEWTTRLDVGWGPPVAGGYVPGNGPTRWPMFSADGRYVSIQTDATNLEVPSEFPVTQVMVYDRETRTPTRVSIKPDGTSPDREAMRPQISADGSTVIFVSPSSNVMPAVPLGTDEIYAAVHFEVTPEEVTVPGRGGQASFSIEAQQYTRWWPNWDWNQYWFGVVGMPVGTGNGTVTFAAFEANPDPQPRSITVTFNDAQSVTFTQEAGLWLTSLSPTSGPMTGGTAVTLRGTGFEPDTRVIFDGYDALSTEYVDSTTLIATTPPHAPATVWVGVFSSDYRSAWLDQAFTYVDTTPPTVTPVIYQGTLGNNGWYTSDVWFYFFYDDPDSQVTAGDGCFPGPLTTDTTGTTFTCTVTSGGGSATASVTIKRDATPPGGIIWTPSEEFLYKRFIYYQTNYVCGDSMSGVASCAGPVPSGQPLPTSVPGPQTFMVRAEDRAGNVGFIFRNYDVGSAVCAPRPDGLIGWWPGDGHTRDIVARHDGTFVGTPNYYSSPYSMGFAFTSNAYLRVADTEALRLTNAFTLSAWVYQVRDWLNPYAVIAGREGEYLLARGPNGRIHYSIANTDPGWGWVDTGIWMDRERWTKLALTYDGTVINLYKNGRLLYARPASGVIGDTAPAENEFRIASRQKSGEPSYFDGAIDDVELVNRPMTLAEIEAAYYSADLGICALPTTLSFTPSPQRAPYGGPAEIVARLTDAQSQPLPGEQVHFTFRNMFAGTAVTDGTGTARMPVSIAGLSAATYANAVQAAHSATAYLQYSNANSDFVIDRAAPTITWNAPAPITYGTALASQQLNATASVSGSYVYSPAAGTVLPAGSQTLGVTFTPFSSNYSSATASVPLTVLKATPTITVNGGSFTYDGNAHAASGTVTGIGGVNLGTLTFTYDGSPNVPVNAGSYAVVGSYAGSANYEAGSRTATLTIGKATPVVAVNGGTFTYDGASHPATGSVTGVGGAQLGPLTFTYNGATDAPLSPGTYNVVASYAGDANYAAASGTATIVINKATPTVAATGGTFTYDGSQHAATGTVTGIGGEDLGPLTFTYNGGSELPLNAGTYSVVAAFAGNANYASASGTAAITIGKATATVSVNGGTFTYDGLAHAATGYVTGIPGEAPGPLTFTYSGASEPPVGAGTYEVIASFAGTSNYLAASGTGTIVIGKATPSVTVNGGSFTYDGASHAATGSATGIGGSSLGPLTFTYNGSANAPVNAGTYDVVGSFAGDANYLAASGTSTITIGKATPVLTWTHPGAIVYGTPLGSTQLNASANVAGTFSYAPAAGVVLGAGGGQPLSASFTPADTGNYVGGSVATAIDVAAAPLIVRANDATKAFGAPLPAFGVTFTGFVNGDTPASLGGALTLNSAAGAGSPVGFYPIFPGGLTAVNYAISFVNGTLSIVRASVDVVVSSGPNPSGFEQPMTFTASVAVLPPGAGLPSGSVRFFDGATLLGTSTLASGSATLSTAGLDVGSRSVTAQYDGDASFDPGSATAIHVVNSAAATPTVSLSSSRNPASLGQSVTLTAAVSMSSGPVSGLVEFYDGGTLIGTASIASGQARFTTSGLAAGSHPVTAQYTGSASAPPARSSVLVQAVTGSGWKNRSTTLSLVASPNPAALGTTVALTATVDGSTTTVPGGRVLFMVDGLVVGNPLGESLTPVSGSDARATLNVPELAHGRHKVTATYLGNSTYRGSTGAVVETVN